MGFASPASDYVERQLSPAILCNIGAESRVLETDMGFAVIEPATKKKPQMQNGLLMLRQLQVDT